MSVTSERRLWIEKIANGSVFDDLSDEEFTTLTDEDHDQPSRKFFEKCIEPCELHFFASLYNWDGGVKDLLRVVRHPLCDLGTALLVYWRGQPGYYLKYADRSDVPKDAVEIYDMLREIEQNVSEGKYRTALQPYDPAEDEGQDQRPKPARIEQYKRNLPSFMYQAIVDSFAKS